MDEGITAVVAGLLIVAIRFLPITLLVALLEWRNGKTVGKFLIGIRVIGVEDGEPIGLIRSIGRRAFMVLASDRMFILIPFNKGVDGHLGDRPTGVIVARDENIARRDFG